MKKELAHELEIDKYKIKIPQFEQRWSEHWSTESGLVFLLLSFDHCSGVKKFILQVSTSVVVVVVVVVVVFVVVAVVVVVDDDVVVVVYFLRK